MLSIEPRVWGFRQVLVPDCSRGARAASCFREGVCGAARLQSSWRRAPRGAPRWPAPKVRRQLCPRCRSESCAGAFSCSDSCLAAVGCLPLLLPLLPGGPWHRRWRPLLSHRATLARPCWHATCRSATGAVFCRRAGGRGSRGRSDFSSTGGRRACCLVGLFFTSAVSFPSVGTPLPVQYDAPALL